MFFGTHGARVSPINKFTCSAQAGFCHKFTICILQLKFVICAYSQHDSAEFCPYYIIYAAC